MVRMAREMNPPAGLPKRFRRLPIEERRRILRERFAPESNGLAPRRTGESRESSTRDFDLTGESRELCELSNVMVESAVGYVGIPLGIADGFIIDGKPYSVPLATEEPSVVAAASYAARIIGNEGGFTTWATEPVMSGQVYLDGDEEMSRRIESVSDELLGVVSESCSRLTARGGGPLSIESSYLGENYIRVSFRVDVRDAMGANIINSTAESLARKITDLTGAEAIMAILTNASTERRAGASFRVSGNSLPGRIIAASRIAELDPERAITHNKGIMNGITALALATGNDTRAIEAAAHGWAGRSGRCLPLTSFTTDGEYLTGSIELPLPFATVGGAATFHPAARAARTILGIESGVGMARIAAAVGLAQNTAALLALVTGGIQKGHMRLHARRLAFEAGARGESVEKTAERIVALGRFNIDSARAVLDAGE